MKVRTLIVVTLGVGVAIIVALGFWRVTYAWRPGALALLLFRDIPLTVCSVIVVLVLELLIFRKEA